MKTATRGHGTIAKRMEKAGLSYEITDVRQIVPFILTGGPWVAVAQWDSRIFVGFYIDRGSARTARDNARRLQGVTSSRVIQVDSDVPSQTDPRNAQPTPSD